MFNQGQILGADGERMSKSRGNVQDPDELVSRYGADTVRLFLMFMGPWDQGGSWSPTGIDGVNRFLRRVWNVVLDPQGSDSSDASDGDDDLSAGADSAAYATAVDKLRRHAHRALAKVTEDHEDFRFNTMISALMELTNHMYRVRGTDVVDGADWDEAVRMLLLMLAPLAPHISEELWSRREAQMGREWTSVHAQSWPDYSPELVAAQEIDLPIQVNGKLRDVITVPAGLSEVEIEQIALARDKVRANLAGNEIVRIIHVPGRLVNIVVRPSK